MRKVVPQEFMPVSEGESAHLIMKPHGFPACIPSLQGHRRAIAQMCSLLGIFCRCKHGHKSVAGASVPQDDMPVSERRICPDLIMNHDGFPLNNSPSIEALMAKF